jgi:hypothetical protein
MRLLFPESDVVAYQSELPLVAVVNRFIWITTGTTGISLNVGIKCGAGESFSLKAGSFFYFY